MTILRDWVNCLLAHKATTGSSRSSLQRVGGARWKPGAAPTGSA